MTLSPTKNGAIRRLLVANRGEIAARIMRSAKDLDIDTVAVYSDPDAQAPFVEAADFAVRLPGSAAADTYLRGDLIIDAARRTGADAVHPGYGFLSENEEFAKDCAAAGLTFVGPPADAIASMGSKIEAKKLMADAGVPTLPGITVDDDPPADLGERAANDVGYPVLVKAAYGGGGRGMRVVHQPADLLDAVESARREAASAFGNGTVFLEHYVESPRHLEVQILADGHGGVVHLFERECSIQRRYQKIIEEAPSPAVDESLRAQLGSAAVAAAEAIGYVGAGTVEFVLAPDGRFFFLEVNTRLQVEHPVTELVTGLDLVALQLQIADGHELPATVRTATLHGHAIEARLYAEDVAAGFLPSTGTVEAFEFPDIAGLRVDSGIRAGFEVGLNYDPMLAKVIAHGPTRDEARRRLSRALAGITLHGLQTNRDLLVGILRETEFAQAQIDTGYLTRHEPSDLMASARDDDSVALHALAAALAGQAARRHDAPVLGTVPSGWRNVPNAPQRITFLEADREIPVEYAVHGRDITATIDGAAYDDVVVYAAEPDRIDLEVNGVRQQVRTRAVDDRWFVDSALGSSTLVEAPRFPDPESNVAPGSLVAPMPGTVVRVGAAVGDEVASGAVLVVLEAMKMEHSLSAPTAGTVTELPVSVGQTVDVGQVLAVIEEDE